MLVSVKGLIVKSNFQFSVENNPGLLWFYLTLLCDWSRKFAPLSEPIRFKTKINRDLVTLVFLRLWQVVVINFGF